MKSLIPKLTFFLLALYLLIFYSNALYSQKLYGVTREGGDFGIGSIFSYNLKTNTLPNKPEHSFSTQYPGAHPNAKLIENNGLFSVGQMLS